MMAASFIAEENLESPAAESVTAGTSLNSIIIDLTEMAEMPDEEAVEQPEVFYVPDSDEEADNDKSNNDESHVRKMRVLMIAKNAK